MPGFAPLGFAASGFAPRGFAASGLAPLGFGFAYEMLAEGVRKRKWPVTGALSCRVTCLVCVLDVDKGCSKEEVASYCLYC